MESPVMEKVKENFCRRVLDNPDLSVGIVAIQTLMEIVRTIDVKTMIELNEKLKRAVDIIKTAPYPVAAIKSSGELFMRFISNASNIDDPSFEECRRILVLRGERFLEQLLLARNKVVKKFSKFILEDNVILTHSRSRLVLQALIYAHQQRKTFHVYVTTCAPDNSGKQMYEELKAAGVSCTLINDVAVGYIMEKVSFVMVGAESAVGNGGILNKLGTYTIAMVAKTLNKPLYVLVESFKFTKDCPLSQSMLSDEFKFLPGTEKVPHSPLVDYTPPQYITLLFTDLGTLTTAAVFDVLLNLYV